MTVPAAPRAPRRTTRWPALLAGAVALGGAALATTAVVRAALHTDGPVLPYALCHAGHAVRLLPELTARRFLTTWQADPVALVLLGAVGTLYLFGARRVSREAADPHDPAASWPAARTASFLAGLLVATAAVCSSVAVYDMTLFWAHMIQHLMLIMLAPALLVTGRPLTLWLAASRAPQRRRIQSVLNSAVVSVVTSPGVALGGYAAAIVGAHLTALTDSILSNAWAGEVEHLTYLLVGLLFFWLVFGDEPLRWRLSMPARLMLLVVAMAVDTFVGVVLLQTTNPVGGLQHPAWGLSPLADTQAGGAVMWVGGDGLMAVLAILLYLSWARRPNQAAATVSVFERVRSGLQAERIRSAPAGAAATDDDLPQLPVDLDTDDRELEAYNRWLAGLDRRG